MSDIFTANYTKSQHVSRKADSELRRSRAGTGAVHLTPAKRIAKNKAAIQKSDVNDPGAITDGQRVVMNEAGDLVPGGAHPAGVGSAQRDLPGEKGK